MADLGVGVAPTVSSYERDVLLLAEAVMTDARVTQAWSEDVRELNPEIERVDFLITVPDPSVEGVGASLELLRLAVDAALVAYTSTLTGTEPSLDLVRQVLAERVELALVDSGYSSFWGKIAQTLRDPGTVALVLLGLTGIALGIASAIVAGTAGVALSLAIAGAGVSAVATVLQPFFAPAPAGDEGGRMFESLDTSLVPADTAIAASAGRSIDVRASAHGRLPHLLRFSDVVRASSPAMGSVTLTEPYTENGAWVELTIDQTVDWGDIVAIAAEFDVELGPPVIGWRIPDDIRL